MPYSHEIEIKGKHNEADHFIEADAEFNTDGKTSYKITNSSDPLPKEVLDAMGRLSGICMILSREGFDLEKIIVQKN